MRSRTLLSVALICAVTAGCQSTPERQRTSFRSDLIALKSTSYKRAVAETMCTRAGADAGQSTARLAESAGAPNVQSLCQRVMDAYLANRISADTTAAFFTGTMSLGEARSVQDATGLNLLPPVD